MVNKITTPPTQNEVINKINEVIDSVPQVTSIYTPSGTDAVNGVAVSNAVATKQDILVSGTTIKTINGNSLLGSGNIEIQTSSNPNVDATTISYNSNNALQTIGVINKNGGTALNIWQGTEAQWNNGEIVETYYYWQTATQALWVAGGDLTKNSGLWASITYGNGVFVTGIDEVTSANKNILFSSDGYSWSSPSVPPKTSNGRYNVGILSDTKNDIIFDDIHNAFVAIDSYGNLITSSDGDVWSTIEPTGYNSSINALFYGNGVIIGILAQSSSVKTYYSTDGGLTWNNGGDLPINSYNFDMAYGDGVFVALIAQNNGNQILCVRSTDNGQTWNSVGSLLNNDYRYGEIAYGNGRFVCSLGLSKTTKYSTDGGLTWNNGGDLPDTPLQQLEYGDGKFVGCIRSSGGKSCYSTDGGLTWTQVLLPDTSKDIYNFAYGNGRFVGTTGRSIYTFVFSVSYDKCYTKDQLPTTSSVVYSEPNVQSQLTISSTTSGAITLSNNNTYYYNQSGNYNVYGTIGEAHPDWLCFINGVGVKIGTTVIATNTPITTTISSSSTDTQAPSAKAVYDTLNP